MRVLYWSDVFWPEVGGTEVLGARLVTALKSRGHEILVVASNAGLDLPAEDDLQGVPIRRFPFWNALATRSLEGLLPVRQAVARLRREFRPDVVHLAFVAPGAFFAVQTAGAHPAPLVVTLQQPTSTLRHGPGASLFGLVLRDAAALACCSEYARREVAGLVPQWRRATAVIYNGAEPPARPAGPIALRPFHVVGVGRLAAVKGFDLALRAVALLAPHLPDVRITLVGDGPVRRDLEALAGELGIGDRTRFAGWGGAQDVAGWLDRASAVVIPSREEMFGLTAVEAAFMARPVAASSTGGLPEVVLDGTTGLLVPSEDPVALAAALSRLAVEPGLARRLGEAARGRALDCFGWNGFVDAYESLYAQVGGGDARCCSQLADSW